MKQIDQIIQKLILMGRIFSAEDVQDYLDKHPDWLLTLTTQEVRLVYPRYGPHHFSHSAHVVAVLCSSWYRTVLYCTHTDLFIKNIYQSQRSMILNTRRVPRINKGPTGMHVDDAIEIED
jgi:hypothetical protein